MVGRIYHIFFNENGGAVISTAIDKYITVIVDYDPKATQRLTLRSQLNSRFITNALGLTGLRDRAKGLTIGVKSDIEKGVGLGGSSAFIVGLLNALYQLKDETPPPTDELAENAFRVERYSLGSPIGKQDHYIAAYGGFRRFDFHRDETTTEMFEPPPLLEKALILFDTGITHNASKIHKEQAQTAKTDTLIKMKYQVDVMDACRYNEDIPAVGALLNEAWELKRSLAPHISNPHLDNIYHTAMAAGAIGGKLLGAGAGGHFLFVVPPKHQDDVRAALSQRRPQPKHIPFSFEPQGSQIRVGEKA